MRTSAGLLALALAASACHLPRPALDATPYAEPLEAWLAPPQFMRGFGDGLEFHVNRPAHVAIFEILPDRGISLLYPGFSAQAERHSAGYHRGNVAFVTGRWYYLSHPIGLAQPRYLVMIASEDPLRLDRILNEPSSLRRDFGVYSFAARRADVAIDQLLNVVLPLNVADGRWTTDVYVDWTGVGAGHTLFAAAPPSARYVRCADGRLVYAYDNVWLSNCYSRRYVRKAAPPTSQPPSEPQQPRVAERREVVTDLERNRGRRQVEKSTPGSRTDVERERRSGTSSLDSPVRSEPRPVRPVEPRAEPRAEPRSEARPNPAPERDSDPRP